MSDRLKDGRTDWHKEKIFPRQEVCEKFGDSDRTGTGGWTLDYDWLDEFDAKTRTCGYYEGSSTEFLEKVLLIAEEYIQGAYADEIRRECGDRGVEWLHSKDAIYNRSLKDGMKRKEQDDSLRAAIEGKEKP